MNKKIKRWRLHQEMKIEILKTLRSFKSKEEPLLKIKEQDFVVVLSEILTSKIKNMVP
jgi:hypothetical protein